MAKLAGWASGFNTRSSLLIKFVGNESCITKHRFVHSDHHIFTRQKNKYGYDIFGTELSRLFRDSTQSRIS